MKIETATFNKKNDSPYSWSLLPQHFYEGDVLSKQYALLPQALGTNQQSTLTQGDRSWAIIAY